MATSSSVLTSVLLTSAVLASACNATSEGTASDSAATETTDAPGDTDTTIPPGDTETTVGPGDTEDSGGPVTSGDTDTTAASDTDTTSVSTDTDTTVGPDPTDTDTAATDTDTGADACPDSDPALENVSVSVWEWAPNADCTVMSASNAAGTVSLDLLCNSEQVAIDLTVPADFKVDVEGLIEVKLSAGQDGFLEGMSFVIHDLATGDFVLAAHQMNGFLTYPELAPFSLAQVGTCGGDACDDISQIEFTHVDGPSLALFPGSRDTLTAGGRNYDIVLRAAWEDLCQDHVGDYIWIIGAST